MKLPPLDPRDYQDIVRRALDEDLIDAAGDAKDVTAEATVPAAARARAVRHERRLRRRRPRRRVRMLPRARAGGGDDGAPWRRRDSKNSQGVRFYVQPLMS
ncbi:MAG: hypothetical protein AUG08_11815 [Acidobacteria bacterium 13_1_20CM_2_55_15]|nr:MAG: hypothetical protein AUG08_11815 [Acidobacteria bacterium 13_1_20CM_2_55_15]